MAQTLADEMGSKALNVLSKEASESLRKPLIEWEKRVKKRIAAKAKAAARAKLIKTLSPATPTKKARSGPTR